MFWIWVVYKLQNKNEPLRVTGWNVHVVNPSCVKYINYKNKPIVCDRSKGTSSVNFQKISDWYSGITSTSPTKGPGIESRDERVLPLQTVHTHGASTGYISRKQTSNVINETANSLGAAWRVKMNDYIFFSTTDLSVFVLNISCLKVRVFF